MKRKSIVLLILSACLFFSSDLLAQVAAVVYQHSNYKGTKKNLYVGSYNVSNLSPVGNDQISSIRVQNGYQLIAYEHSNYRGAKKVYTGNVSFTSGFNDKISSIKVVRLNRSSTRANYTPPSGYTRCAYENGTYRLSRAADVAYGANGRFKYKRNVTGTVRFNNQFFGGDPVPNVRKAGYYKYRSGKPVLGGSYLAIVYRDGSYLGPSQTIRRAGNYDLGQITIGGDKISSIKVKSGYELVAYEHPRYRGASKVYRRNTSFVRDFNDRISSFKVRKIGGATTVDYTPPRGYTRCAYENQTFRLARTADIAYGANGKFKFRTGASGTIRFNNQTFEGDPIPNVRKAGYYKYTGGSVPPVVNSSDINKRNALGTQTVNRSQRPGADNPSASWNYRGNLGRREVNANSLGRCYDVRKLDLLNWTHETLQSGQSANVFELYRDDSRRPARLNNQDHVVPYGVVFQSAIYSDAQEQYKYVVTASQFESEVMQEYRGSVGVGKLGSAKVSVGFKDKASSSVQSEEMFTFTKMKKQLYKLDLELDNPSYKHRITPRFWEGVRKLGHEMSAMEFIRKFGSHFAASTYYGGNYLQRRSVSKNQFSNSVCNEMEFKADVEATIKKVTVGAGTTQGRKNCSSNSNGITIRDKKILTVGGNPDFDNPRRWSRTVNNNPEIISGRLVRISDILTSNFFPNIPNINAKRNLLRKAEDKVIRAAQANLSRRTTNNFFTKEPVTYKFTVWNMKCTGQGSGEPGSASEYYGKLYMGFFDGNRSILNGKRRTIWNKNEDHTVDFTTNMEKSLRNSLTLMVYPKDIANGYVKVWGWMKEDDSPDTKLSSYSQTSKAGAIKLSSAMSINNAIPGQLVFTSKAGDVMTVKYELKRIK